MAEIFSETSRERLQNVVFKVALCIVAITSGIIQNSALEKLKHDASHEMLLIVYIIAMFLSFSFGVAMLVLSMLHSNGVVLSPLVARGLMFVSLGFLYIAVAVGTVMELVGVSE